MREIRTLRSEGVGTANMAVPSTRQAPGNGCPYRDCSFFSIMKCYPTFDEAGFYFDVDRSSCCRWAHWFLPALQETLGKELVLPERKVCDPEEFLRLFPEVQGIFIDAPERPIQRPKDNKKQKEHYSGKKKRHTRKNIRLVA